jgi:type II secretory pathway pseudopilin PulG
VLHYQQSFMMRPRKIFGFTLIELLTVITIIIILAGLVLSVAGYVQRKGASSRAQSEIAAMSSALESYKADNGAYPEDNGTSDSKYTDNLDPRATTSYNPSAYTNAGLVLYRALSGDRNLDGTNDSNVIASSLDVKLDVGGATLSPALTAQIPVYYPFKSSQLQTSSTGTVTALIDPFGYPYGFGTSYQGQVNSGVSAPTMGYNPTFDLWSTRGTTTIAASGTAAVWLTNW